jgi:hypothetical protein
VRGGALIGEVARAVVAVQTDTCVQLVSVELGCVVHSIECRPDDVVTVTPGVVVVGGVTRLFDDNGVMQPSPPLTSLQCWTGKSMWTVNEGCIRCDCRAALKLEYKQQWLLHATKLAASATTAACVVPHRVLVYRIDNEKLVESQYPCIDGTELCVSGDQVYLTNAECVYQALAHGWNECREFCAAKETKPTEARVVLETCESGTYARFSDNCSNVAMRGAHLELDGAVMSVAANVACTQLAILSDCALRVMNINAQTPLADLAITTPHGSTVAFAPDDASCVVVGPHRRVLHRYRIEPNRVYRLPIAPPTVRGTVYAYDGIHNQLGTEDVYFSGTNN